MAKKTLSPNCLLKILQRGLINGGRCRTTRNLQPPLLAMQALQNKPATARMAPAAIRNFQSRFHFVVSSLILFQPPSSCWIDNPGRQSPMAIVSDQAGSDPALAVFNRFRFRPVMSTLHSDGRPFAPGVSRKNDSTRPFGAQVGPSD